MARRQVLIDGQYGREQGGKSKKQRPRDVERLHCANLELNGGCQEGERGRVVGEYSERWLAFYISFPNLLILPDLGTPRT